MSSKIVVEFEVEENSTIQIAKWRAADRHNVLVNLSTLCDSINAGTENCAFNVKFGAVQASLAGTFTGAPANNDTITINGVVFTAKTSGATGNQFNIGGTVTISATNLAAAVNASATAGILDVVGATSLAGVITLWSKQAGKVGNSIPVTESLANFTLAGGAVIMAGGTATNNDSHSNGLLASVPW